jgi:NAD(P)-dependent dehydrogenase (short-subunit alcohol dehydrogenase family)
MGLSEDVIEAKRVERAKEYPIGRIGECEDIANCVAFLASDESSFITGISLIADGGFLNV